MLSKTEFCSNFHDFFHRYEMTLSQASTTLGVSRLRVYLYLTGIFRFDEKRETAVSNRMSNYVLQQKIMRAWLRRRNGGVPR
jgi:hypothetical protein